ncbi:pilus assembly protein TadG-related protein [Emcibacter sp. SYSU 3D8]|uniref:pilus assembly protein TadG-related protein n=1 Tax=Emcibacter sp. SYSU 3D8 TaxID=3133969 RepID=UPI0031FE5D95
MSLLRRACADTKGSVAIIVAIAMIALLGVTAIVVDISYIYNVRRQLQNATDQSALAGAQNIYQGSAVSTANSYSATSGNKNVSPGVTVTMVSGYPLLKCLSSTGLPCAGTPPANAITVMQTATVPLFFARIFGKNTADITVQATASAAGNQPKPYNIILIIDTTGSMDTNDGNCNGTTQTRITCAKLGGQQLLKGMYPSMDQVGLMTFPGVSSATKTKHYNCSTDEASSVAYNASPTYSIVALSNDYKASDASTTLVTGSNLVRAFGGGGSGCAQGMGTPGGQGTYFADVISAAQTQLLANATTGTQAIIILLSDGDAGATSSKVGSAKYDDQCQQAVNAAAAAKNDATTKTWIYAVAYSAPTSGGCNRDSPYISPCNTMKAIASSDDKFFASGGSCTSPVNNMSDLVSIFARIQSSLTSPRLVPDNTT